MKPSKLPDGLSELEAEMPLIMKIIERTARWVNPATFRELPLWFPEYARGCQLYDSAWTQVRLNKKEPKREGNVQAGIGLTKALGLRGKKPANWTVCHVWGYDDEKFAGKSNIVQNPYYYSCIGNMVLLPTPLKGFTDSVGHIKNCLRYCAFQMYGWMCEHPDVQGKAEELRAAGPPTNYPSTWPTPSQPNLLPRGTAPFDENVRKAVASRKAAINRALQDQSLTHYPRQQVRDALNFWKIELSSS